MGEWISVNDRLPGESGNVLCVSMGILMLANYSAKHEKFNAFDDLPEANYALTSVTHWMPAPELPKEE